MREFTNPTFDGACVCCNKQPKLTEALIVLRNDNLVWDQDFEKIRSDLAHLLEYINKYVSKSGKAAIQPALDDLLDKIVGEEC
jgi:hypothetical protein